MYFRKTEKSEDEAYNLMDMGQDDENLPHRKRVKRLLEDRLDKRRLKMELDEFDGELDEDFDWDQLGR